MDCRLTLNHLNLLWDEIRRIVYVHPDDLSQPILDVFRAEKYEIQKREHMVKGKAWFQNMGVAGVIDFETREVFFGKNRLTWYVAPLYMPQRAHERDC